MVDLFISNTDNDWFDFLTAQSNLDEVNFWKPSGTSFKALTAGELFVFRLKSPRNKIGGFGVFWDSSVLPLQIAWDTFQEKNGAASYQAMRTAIAQYRPNETIDGATNIGCRILVQPLFLTQFLWFDLPLSWSSNIQGGKRYSTETTEGRNLWEKLQDLSAQLQAPIIGGLSESGNRYGEPTTIRPRLGQGAFRIAVTEAYGRKCAITNGKVLPALDAVHIRPYGEGGAHTIPNGILMRKDIHSVFDAGYATIDPDFRFVVSDKVRTVFDNGSEYRRLHGLKIQVPTKPSFRPDVELLKWHNESVFERI
jgi:putative restriction endonuclease